MMTVKPFKFSARLIISYIVVILISFGFLAFLLDKNLEEQALNEIETSLANQVKLVAQQIPFAALRSGDAAVLNNLAKKLDATIDARVTIIGRDGRVLADSERSSAQVLEMENHGRRPEVIAALDGVTGSALRYSATLKIDMLYVAVALTDKADIIGVVRLARPLVHIQKELASVRRIILLSILLALALALVLGSLLSRSIIRPINKIIHGAQRFSKGDLSHKILLDTPDEIGSLAWALNMMAQDIEDNIEAVEIQNQQLKAILQSMVEGIIVVDRDSRIRSVNPSIERIFGVWQEAVCNTLFLEAIPNNDIADVITAVFREGKLVSRELELTWPVKKIVRINGIAIRDKGVINGCLVVIHDITEMRRLETVRSDFVANVSHELKTPLTSIKGFVETLLEGALDDRENARHFLEIIRDHTYRLDALVNDLLSLSHLESKEITVEKKNVNLKGLIDGILAGFKSQIKKKSLNIKNSLLADVSVVADSDKLSQVLTNLIDNAIKFNKDKGLVVLSCEETDQQIKVIVEDTGSGIPPKDLPRIFERFYRVDKARSRELGGTGLGLSIVKHIVELHGGHIGVESVEGMGSKFFFLLPK